MQDRTMLSICAVIMVVLANVHMAQDIILGFSPGGLTNLIVVAIAVVWLCGPLVLGETRSAYVVALLGSLLGFLVTVLHLMGRGVGPDSRVGKSSVAFFFIWTILTLGVAAIFSVILSVRGLWNLRRSAQR